MTNKTSVSSYVNGRFAFFQQFLKHPLQIGSVIPSSRFLEQRILAAADIASASSIVELGPGTGGTTRAILDCMPEHARLLSIEINPLFYNMLSNIQDRRLTVHLGSACDLKKIISQHQLAAPEAIISGIPFSTMNYHDGSQVLEAISNTLAANGRFVAYQVSNRVDIMCQPYMGTADTMIEFFNIPPMRIFQWQKKAN